MPGMAAVSIITGIKEPLYVERQGRELKCTWRTINSGLFGRPSGYLVEIVDDTNQRKYLKLLSNYSSQLEDEVKR